MSEGTTETLAATEAEYTGERARYASTELIEAGRAVSRALDASPEAERPTVFFPNFPTEPDQSEEGRYEYEERYARIRRAARAIRAKKREEGEATDADVERHTVSKADLAALLHYVVDMLEE
jgi:hypothetical protein